MAYDVRAIAEHLGAELVAGAVDGATPVEGSVALADLVLASPPGYATLVVAAPADWAAALASDDGRPPLTGSVAIIAGGTAGGPLRAVLIDRGITAVVVPGLAADVVHARLTALIAADQAAEDAGSRPGPRCSPRWRAAAGW